MGKIIDPREADIPSRFLLRSAGLVVYPLGDDMIVRTNSGFTSKGVRKLAKYAKTRHNYQEFGKLSSLCKQVRMALSALLPKKNNLAVVNSFTKRMRVVMTHDMISAPGERNLANALASESGRQALQGYAFNPDANIHIDYRLLGTQLIIGTKNCNFPEHANAMGFRVSVLEFDFATQASQLVSSVWHFFGKASLDKEVVLATPTLERQSGVLITILEVQFYNALDGDYVVVGDEVGKGVRVVGVSD